MHSKPEKFTLGKSVTVSVTIHVILFVLAFAIAEILSYFFLLLGINLDLFAKPTMKIKDIEFVFVLPEKYDIKKYTTLLLSDIGNKRNILSSACNLFLNIFT